MADMLSLTERGLNQPVVTRYVGMFTRTVLSAAFGTNLSSEGNQESAQVNCVVQIEDDTLYCVLYDGLYRSVDSGATFSSIFTFTNTPVANASERLAHGGLQMVYDAGANSIVFTSWFKRATGDLAVGWTYRLSDAATAEVVGPTLGATDNVLGHELMWNNSIFFNYGSGSEQGTRFLEWGPLTSSWTSHTPPWPAGIGTRASNCYCAAPDGQLYFMAPNSNSSTIRLARYNGAWSDLGSLLPMTGGLLNNADESRMALFSDGTDLHAVVLFQTPQIGWRHYRITGASGFDPTVAVNETALTVPADLTGIGDGGSANFGGTNRCMVVQDTETTPGTLRTFLFFSIDAAPGTSWSVREFQGVGTNYSFVGVGGAVRDSIASGNTTGGGGAYFYTPGQDGVRIVSVGPGASGEVITFVASGGGTVDVRFRQAGSSQPATPEATLTGSATGGGTRVGNQVQGVTADGVTLNTVPWDFATDSKTGGQGNVVLIPETV